MMDETFVYSAERASTSLTALSAMPSCDNVFVAAATE